MDFEEFGEKVVELAREITSRRCPIWQCGGELEPLEERTNWQEPDFRCKSCGSLWELKNPSSWPGDEK